jgi:hypothetical protein
MHSDLHTSYMSLHILFDVKYVVMFILVHLMRILFDVRKVTFYHKYSHLFNVHTVILP